MNTLERIAFKHPKHEQQFTSFAQEQIAIRKTLYKRELAVLFTLAAMDTAEYKDLLHERGCFPQLDVAILKQETGEMNATDVALFALAVNLHNGQDVFEELGIEGSATPYHFLCLLKDNIAVMTEALKIYREGYPLT